MSPRRRLLRWVGWFAVVNAALLALVGLRYLWHYATLGRAVSWSYALVAYVGHLSALAASTRHKAYKVELNARVASILIGPGAVRLAEIEERTKRRFLIEAREELPVEPRNRVICTLTNTSECSGYWKICATACGH